MNKHYSNTRGMSLIEILIVLALIAVIATLVITNVQGLFSGGQEDVARLWVNESIETPLAAYRIHVGTYPSTDEGLQALVTAPEGKEDRWRGPYLKKMPVDPWKNPYQYRFPGEKNKTKYDVWSRGPDGIDSDDDIGNW
ncbi:MAG: type II secretion system protein GspG [Verrucomicrobia bacterium GWF2_51_19]|nr:MAG: type II secretion system protein GspG [Verrucomicrobia bacterium GWF2_51_19]HCJ11848.1 type II secretion system protein GspG [Opitutae bacterium]